MSFLCPNATLPRLCRALAAMVLCGGLAIAGCKREERAFGATPSEVQTVSAVPVTDLIPGLPPATSPATQPTTISSASFHDNYQNNAFALSEGQRLYEQYNCNTCHAHGGGD